MGIGTPTTLGSTGNTSSASTGLNITTTAPIGSGNLVVVAVYVGGSATVSTVSDGTNTYTKRVVSGGAVQEAELWFKQGASAVSSGATVAITLSGSIGAGTAVVGAVAQCTGVLTSASTDSTGAATGSSSTPSVASGALAQATEIAFGALGYSGAATFTEAATFTNLYAFNGGNNMQLALSYDITATTTAVTYNPTLSASATWRAIVATFKGTASAASRAVLRTRMGVGV